MFEQQVIIMVEYFTKQPDMLRITTYTGKDRPIDPDKVNNDNSNTMYSFYKEVDKKYWVDFERPELKDPNKIFELMENSHPTEDWKYFEKVLWGKKESGEEGIIWDMKNVERLMGKVSKCCDIVEEGSKKIMVCAKEALKIIKDIRAKGESEVGKADINKSEVIDVLNTWNLMKEKDTCQDCQKIIKESRDEFKSLGWIK